MSPLISFGRLGFAAAALALLACERPRDAAPREPRADTPAAAPAAAPPAAPPAALDSVVVQDRADWDSLEAHLPTRPDSAAAALERYRQAHGLPLDFDVKRDAPDALLRSLRTEEDEMAGGTPSISAFVRRMPTHHVVLDVSPVIEFDTAGRILRRWPLPNDIGYSEVVVGVHGDELVTTYRPQGVFLRVRPDGEYRISAEPPQALPPEQWIEVADSIYLRVRPKDDVDFYLYPVLARPEPAPGRWEPRGESGLYVRTDSGPKQGAVARAMTLDRSRTPRMVNCPESAGFVGMNCRAFPDGAAERRLAYPIPES